MHDSQITQQIISHLLCRLKTVIRILCHRSATNRLQPSVNLATQIVWTWHRGVYDGFQNVLKSAAIGKALRQNLKQKERLDCKRHYEYPLLLLVPAPATCTRAFR